MIAVCLQVSCLFTCQLFVFNQLVFTCQLFVYKICWFCCFLKKYLVLALLDRSIFYLVSVGEVYWHYTHVSKISKRSRTPCISFEILLRIFNLGAVIFFQGWKSNFCFSEKWWVQLRNEVVNIFQSQIWDSWN